jgi:hypothetical protein
MTNGLCASLHVSREEALALMAAAELEEKVRGERLTLEELGRLSDAWTERKTERKTEA